MHRVQGSSGSVSRYRLAWALALGALLAAGGAARAQTPPDGPPPPQRLVYRNALFFRSNPIGLIDDARISYRWRLYPNESLALRDNFIGVGLAPAASPAFARVGALVEVQPLTLLQLYGIYEWVRYFGTFNYLQSFPSARSEFSDAVLSDLGALPPGDFRRNYATSGTQLTLGANLQVKVGPVAARSMFRLVHPDYVLREGDTVFYDNVYDVLAPNHGWYLTNDADVLYVGSENRLAVGLRWTVTQPFYGPEHFAPGEPQENLNGPMHRLGPLFAYTFFNKAGAAFNSPTVIVLANWWLAHRYRAGQQVPQLLPMVAVGFSFSGDLLPARETGP